MIDEENKPVENSSDTSQSADTDELALMTTAAKDLSKESLEILNQVVVEHNPEKSKDLTELFNQNQKKKTMIRVNKLNDLLDKITDQAIERFSKKPDEISNQELLQGLKIVQDSLERGQNQVNNEVSTPLIQVNQQEINVNTGEAESMSKESRDRIKSAVASVLAGIIPPKKSQDIIDATVDENEEVKVEDKQND